MRALCLAILSLAVAAPAFAADCTNDVLAAFAKQRASKAFRVEFSQPTVEGEVHMTIDYMPPNRMLQTVTSPAMPGEQQTMLVGDRAFAGTSGAFEELLPQFTQSIVAEANQAMFAQPNGLGNFECLGPAKLDGQDFVAYRTADKAPANADHAKAMARTIYVDPVTGLPAFNIVANLTEGAKPLLKVKYSYPTDIDIVAPTNAPVQKLR
ncbi:hypothetical protein [Hyphomicrobium sp. 99]|uniref:hypothetical protein n=1 Tax=Hyphomicrobium sp. 99 TaxID=1163419 RepID=UPI0005F778E8|nr:hypothetical protein [Hyphomicrobium sp. 99]